MGSFSASLKTIGNSRGLPATIELDEGRLSITSGDADIGAWSLTDVGLEPTPNGFRLAAEGDHLLIEMPDKEQFAEELARSSKQKRLNGLRSKTKGRKVKSSSAEIATQEPTPSQTPAKPPPQTRAPAPPSPEDRDMARDVIERMDTPKSEDPRPGPIFAALDAIIKAAERRWGSLLPEWVFTRAILITALVLLGVAFVFRNVTSLALVIIGIVTLMIGGVSYTDDVMASKILPGRTTAQHVLFTGVTLLVMGVVFGIIA